MTETVYCPYCVEPFERVGRKYRWDAEPKATCGKQLCKIRMSAWNAWVRNGRVNAIAGDVNKPAKGFQRLPGMSTKAAALLNQSYPSESYQLQLEEAA
jgi:hypothetical protein